MRVWVTRDEPKDGPLSTALRAVGQDVLHAPVVKRTLVGDPGQLLADMQEGDWLVLTSPFAIRSIPAAIADKARIAVVGEASRRAAEKCGLNVTFLPSEPSGAALFQELAANLPRSKKTRVWYPRSAAAECPAFPSSVCCASPVLYKTHAIAYDTELALQAEMIAFASPTAVRGVAQIDVQCASIGPTTTAALDACGITPAVIASHPTFKELATAIQAFSESRHQRA